MVLYKFKEPKKAENKPENTSNHKETKDSTYHYDSMKQLMDQKNGVNKTKISFKKRKKRKSLDDAAFVKAVVVVVLVMGLICSMFIIYSFFSSFDNTSETQSATVESHSEKVASDYSSNNESNITLPEKWEVTVNKDNPNVDFSDLAKLISYDKHTGYYLFDVYEDDECIVSNMDDSMLNTLWPAYDYCNDKETTTYKLTVRIVETSLSSGVDEIEIGTVPLILTVER